MGTHWGERDVAETRVGRPREGEADWSMRARELEGTPPTCDAFDHPCHTETRDVRDDFEKN